MESNFKQKVVYCISGLGADDMIFNGYNLGCFQLQYISWLQPFKNETLESYSERMGEVIVDDNAVILGVSFGAMIAIEIAKKKKIQKLILISTAKTKDELPFWMKITGKLNLHKALLIKSIKLTERFDNRQLGIKTKEEALIAKKYRKSGNKEMLRWGVDKVLNWKNEYLPPKYIHIHGSDDRVFPIKNAVPTHIIKEGSHIMVLNKKNEIQKIILDELSDIII